VRRAAPLVAFAIQELAAHTPTWWDQLRLVDSQYPGPLACDLTRRARWVAVDGGRRVWRMGWAGQAAFAVVGGFLWGFLVGFLIAG
jgi:hypothetical protein